MPISVTLTTVTTPPTAVVTSELRERGVALRAARLSGDLPAVLVVLACAWWLLLAPRLWGGRGHGAVTVGAILVAVATLAIRPHRHLPARVIWFALAVSVAAFGVAALSPTGWSGASTAASYVCVSWTVVAVAAGVARDKRVVNLLLLLVVVGVLVEVAESWLAWWGGSNAAAPITGTFYWYDPFAAFLIAGTVLGLSLWLRRTGPVATLGLVTFALGSIGLVYSTSRAADACFALAAIIVCGVHLLSNRVQGLRRVAVALAVGAFSVWAIAGPPFFAHRALPLAGTSARASGQSLGQNGGYRMDFWREALGVFRRHVLTGGGFHSLAAESQGHVPATWPLSPLAHNGYLQALSDGGLLLGVPFVLAALAVAWWVLSALVRSVRARDFSTQAFVLPLCLGALLAHSVVDFDWSYAADFTLVAILAGVLAGTRYSERTPHRSSLSSRAVAGAVLAGVVLTGVAAVTSWPGDVGQSLPITHAAPTWEAM